MDSKRVINRLRIILGGILAIPSILLGFYLLSKFMHNSIIYILVLSLLAVIGHLINKKLNELAKKELNKLEDMFQGIEFPKSLLKIRDFGFELVFPLLLLTLGADPIKDFIELKPIIIKVNYLFFDIALFVLFVSLVPMFLWMFYRVIKESIKNYW
ncbi:hypothetical protein [Paenibacillus dendritiformis]|uniref:hypothetical protein n=1 Tax=Paenibacillus dendritiformis TaxID=130049 RepID=UPI00387E0FD7